MILKNGLGKDVLLQQRVNKKWRGVVQGSRALRRKLYYDVDFIEDNDEGSKYVEWNGRERVRWNPLLTSFWIGHTEMEDCCRQVDLGVIKNFDCPTVSWRAMHMTSPPARKVTLFNGFVTWGTLFSKSGITIGKLAETQQEGSSLRIDETGPQELAILLRAFKLVKWLGLFCSKFPTNSSGSEAPTKAMD